MSAFAAVSQDDDDEADSRVVAVNDFRIQDIATYELIQENTTRVRWRSLPQSGIQIRSS